MPTTYRRNRDALYALTRAADGICSRCLLRFDWFAPPRSRHAFTADHIVPRSHGGSDDPDNLTPAHYSCNSSRGNRPFTTVTPLALPDPTSETWP